MTDSRTMDSRDSRRRLRELLTSSIDWNSWHEALTTFFELEEIDNKATTAGRPPPKLVQCLDTSLVIQYLVPHSLSEERQDYPRPIDLALLILFRAGQRPSILPPHYAEMEALKEDWKARLRQMGQRLSVIKERITDLEKRLEEKSGAALGDAWITQFYEFLRQEAHSLGPILYLAASGWRSFGAVEDRLEVVGARTFPFLEGWSYKPDRERLEEWYNDLSAFKDGRGGPPAHRTDAHALHLLELLNERLASEGFYLVLYTSGRKIWKALADRRKSDKEALRRDGIDLVQRPEVALVREFLRQAENNNTLEPERESLLKERERNEVLSLRRQQLQNSFESLRSDSQVLALPEHFEDWVKEMEDGFQHLRSVVLERDRWKSVSLALEADAWAETGLFAKLRRADNRDKGELRALLRHEIDGLQEKIEGLQRGLTLSRPAPPGRSIFFEPKEEQGSHFLLTRGILRGTRGTPIYSVQFRSKEFGDFLRRIQLLLEELRKEDLPEEGRTQVALALSREMAVAEATLKREPEFYLFLAAAYCSHELWFQALDSTEIGLAQLEEGAAPVDHIKSSVRAELSLLRGFSLRNWTLQFYSDLREVATAFLEQAARAVRESLVYQKERTRSLGWSAARDPRCLRELGVIFGTAREEGLNITPVLEDWELAGLSEESSGDELLVLFCALARGALEANGEDRQMRIYYVNSYLYALVERDHDEDLPQRMELARELAARTDQRDAPNLQDTLAWHHFHLARRYIDRQAEFELHLSQARELIEDAWMKIQSTDHKYQRRLISKHRRAISSL